MDFNIKRKPNTDSILKAIQDNDGYCPCILHRTADTKCICKEFPEQTESGECRCGLYIKETINNV